MLKTQLAGLWVGLLAGGATVVSAPMARAQTDERPIPEAQPGSQADPPETQPEPPEAQPEAPPAASDAESKDTTADEDLSDIESALAQDRAAQAAGGDAARPEPAAPSVQAGSGASAAAGALRALLNPDVSVILDVAAAGFSDQSRQLQTGAHDPTINGFNLQQLELSFIKNVDPYFRFDSHLVFGPDGFELEEAYATTLGLPYGLQVRGGQFLTQFGRINATHPHTWSFVDQPFAIGRDFGGDGNRGLGVEVSYLAPLPFYLMLVGSLTDPYGDETDRSFLGDDERAVESPLDLQKTVAVKEFVDLSDDWSLLTGQSFASAPNAFGIDTRTDIYGIDLYLKWRPISHESQQQVTLQTEWLLRRMQIGSRAPRDLSGYAYVTWRFLKRWQVAARYELGTPARDGGVLDPLDPEWVEDRHRVAANVTFWPTEFSRLRLQGAVDDATWQDPVYATFLAFEVVVGAHGAHTF